MIVQRTTSLLAILAVVACALFILSKSTNTTFETVSHVKFGPSRYIPTKFPSFEDIRHPFRPAAHEPPEQAHSTSGESKWFSDWKWLHPFSSSITLDEHRTVLPPLPERPPVYTFYEPNSKYDEAQEKADGQLLLAWRRAWYAKGFRPVVLSRAEAMKNPLYEEVQRRELKPELEQDFFKWLAWGHMGSGLFADWLCFPMARYDDPIFLYLRAGAIPTHITRFETLDRALFAGEKTRINDAIKFAIQDPRDGASSILSVIPPEFFAVEQSNALAYYSQSVVTASYPQLAEKYASDAAAGRQALAELIDAHLHTTFLNSFPSGFTVLKPIPDHTTALVEPAMHLAQALSKCPSSELPGPCPPNRPNCQPCNSKSRSVSISQPKSFNNASDIYTIGVLPHPLTLITLQRGSDEVDTAYIRRETTRDPWLAEVTTELVGANRAGSTRVVAFKEVVAGEEYAHRTFWMTVETLLAKEGEDLPSTLVSELSWNFGFKVDTEDAEDDAKKFQDEAKEQPSLVKEYELIAKARNWLHDQPNRVGLRNIAEAWNLADIEVWRFVQAYRARSVVERQRWEKEEQNFLGARVD
ncbi:hypothetical protein UA08_04755 [Talaromyces atroroseus]|uniref:Uncharacterized protein n=1 Tax=Talaromyces atroroseus TaxID=1441469 RepID=A0A225AFD1_TALAT|nr:hypothetical protein UA08_04755 [Talaromyces atroroseus]OKL60021.1 hypothetical protein UA08_04755 [Talaromyces atroroseus]